MTATWDIVSDYIESSCDNARDYYQCLHAVYQKWKATVSDTLLEEEDIYRPGSAFHSEANEAFEGYREKEKAIIRTLKERCGYPVDKPLPLERDGTNEDLPSDSLSAAGLIVWHHKSWIEEFACNCKLFPYQGIFEEEDERVGIKKYLHDPLPNGLSARHLEELRIAASHHYADIWVPYAN